MKYKVGDKLRVRSWKAMEREFGLDEEGDIKFTNPGDVLFIKIMEEEIKSFDRIITICSEEAGFYKIKEDNGVNDWQEECFEGYYFEYGEEAEFSNCGDDWGERRYLGYTDGSEYPYQSVAISHENNFSNGITFASHGWLYARPIKKEENKKQDNAKKLKTILERICAIEETISDLKDEVDEMVQF